MVPFGAMPTLIGAWLCGRPPAEPEPPGVDTVIRMLQDLGAAVERGAHRTELWASVVAAAALLVLATLAVVVAYGSAAGRGFRAHVEEMNSHVYQLHARHQDDRRVIDALVRQNSFNRDQLVCALLSSSTAPSETNEADRRPLTPVHCLIGQRLQSTNQHATAARLASRLAHWTSTTSGIDSDGECT